jgi:hypothetical protein
MTTMQNLALNFGQDQLYTDSDSRLMPHPPKYKDDNERNAARKAQKLKYAQSTRSVLFHLVNEF